MPKKIARKPKAARKVATKPASTRAKRVPPFRLIPRNQMQQQYVDTIRTNSLTFGIGPAGTGKTYIAVGLAVEALQQGAVEKIILVRPVIEAGERLGFLPGDMREKVDPYMRPIYDALYEMLGKEQTERLIDSGVIEIAPLAFMRGRTLKRAFIIADESQNTTREQMKMLLTRFGKGFKAVVTGDLRQVDLPKSVESGLLDAERLLKSIEGIGFTYFIDADVVRHPLVQKIVRAYESE